MTAHRHCDGDPIECEVEALQSEYHALLEKHRRLRAAIAPLRQLVVAARTTTHVYNVDGTDSPACRICNALADLDDPNKQPNTGAMHI